MAKALHRAGGERVISAIRVPDAVYEALCEKRAAESLATGKPVPMSSVVRKILIESLIEKQGSQ